MSHLKCYLVLSTTIDTSYYRGRRYLIKRYECACRRILGAAVYLHKESCLTSADGHTTAFATMVVQTDSTAKAA